jgi:hypothetical protein
MKKYLKRCHKALQNHHEKYPLPALRLYALNQNCRSGHTGHRRAGNILCGAILRAISRTDARRRRRNEPGVADAYPAFCRPLRKGLPAAATFCGGFSFWQKKSPRDARANSLFRRARTRARQRRRAEPAADRLAGTGRRLAPEGPRVAPSSSRGSFPSRLPRGRPGSRTAPKRMPP